MKYVELSAICLLIACLGTTDAVLEKDFMDAMNQQGNWQTKKKSQQKSDNSFPFPSSIDMQHNANFLKRLLNDANYNNNDDASTSSLDLSEYALRYIGCQNVKSWDDNLASQGSGKVVSTNKFVMFRLCQKSICSNYNKYGCDYNYGEYVVPMETYLQAMAYYHLERYQDYCAVCSSCMTGTNLTSDDDTYDFSNYINFDGNGTFSPVTDCLYYNACRTYEKTCQGTSSATGLEDYFTCSQFQVGNNVAYLGPHCASDGHSLAIGIFEDDACSDYIGDIVDLEDFTGMAFDSDGMEFYSSEYCISCVNGDEYNLDTDDAADGSVYPLCSMMYSESAKCNRYLDVSDVGDTYGSEDQEGTEDLACTFIASLIENHYSESGEIALGNDSFDFKNWRDSNEYAKLTNNVTTGQKVGLVISAFLMIGLLIYTTVLYHRVVRRIPSVKQPWHRHEVDDDASVAGKISRTASGIMMGRSNSSQESSGNDVVNFHYNATPHQPYQQPYHQHHDGGMAPPPPPPPPQPLSVSPHYHGDAVPSTSPVTALHHHQRVQGAFA